MAAQTFTPAQLYGSGSIITISMDNSTTFDLNKDAANVGNNHVYLTFYVIGGSSTAIPGLDNSTFTLIDNNAGDNLHVAYSTNNWAYSFPGGTHDTGATVVASDLPTITANTMRVKALGMTPSNATTCLTLTT